MGAEPWFRSGLRFSCERCGACCSGAPGAVWLREEDIDRMARRLGVSPCRFEREYVRQRGLRKRLYEWPDGDCVFYQPEHQRCSVHDGRPWQCRRWPFWPANLASAEAWREVKRVCPGAGRGQLHSLQAIRDLMDR